LSELTRLAANKQDLHINGIVKLNGTYYDTLIYMNCLVTANLKNKIIVSWHDAHWIGAVIRPDYGDRSLPPYTVSMPRCNAVSSPQKQLPPPLSDAKKDKNFKTLVRKIPLFE
jgi:hypothetical protein